MKFSKFKLILSLAALIVALYSCKDNTTNPTSTKDYYPMTVGNYWVYQSYETDSTGKMDQSKMSIDSTYIKGTTEKLGHQAYIFVTTENDTAPSENYFYRDGAKLYAFSNFLSPSGEAGNFFKVSDRWVLVADDNGSQWSILDTTLKDIPLDFGGFNVTLSGNLSFTGQKGTMTSVKWGKAQDKSVSAQEFITNIKFTGTVSGLFNITMSSAIHTYYADKIGPVKTKMDPFKIVTGLPGGNSTMSGYENVMINYNVK